MRGERKAGVVAAISRRVAAARRPKNGAIAYACYTCVVRRVDRATAFSCHLNLERRPVDNNMALRTYVCITKKGQNDKIILLSFQIFYKAAWKK